MTQPTIIALPNGDVDVSINVIQTKKALINLRALNHKLRLQLLELIDANKGTTVTELFVKLRIEQSVASQHLATLRRAGYVKTTRKGKFIYYHINYEKVNEITKLIEQMV